MSHGLLGDIIKGARDVSRAVHNIGGVGTTLGREFHNNAKAVAQITHVGGYYHKESNDIQVGAIRSDAAVLNAQNSVANAQTAGINTELRYQKAEDRLNEYEQNRGQGQGGVGVNGQPVRPNGVAAAAGGAHDPVQDLILDLRGNDPEKKKLAEDTLNKLANEAVQPIPGKHYATGEIDKNGDPVTIVFGNTPYTGANFENALDLKIKALTTPAPAVTQPPAPNGQTQQPAAAAPDLKPLMDAIITGDEATIKAALKTYVDAAPKDTDGKVHLPGSAAAPVNITYTNTDGNTINFQYKGESKDPTTLVADLTAHMKTAHVAITEQPAAQTTTPAQAPAQAPAPAAQEWEVRKGADQTVALFQVMAESLGFATDVGDVGGKTDHKVDGIKGEKTIKAIHAAEDRLHLAHTDNVTPELLDKLKHDPEIMKTFGTVKDGGNDVANINIQTVGTKQVVQGVATTV